MQKEIINTMGHYVICMAFDRALDMFYRLEGIADNYDAHWQVNGHCIDD